MSVLDIFKKKEEAAEKQPVVEKKAPQKKERKKKEKTESLPKAAKAAEVAAPKHKNEQISGEMAWVLQSPQISEKAGYLAENNQYVFRVSKRANKAEIKKAVEGTFGINVASVRIINVPGKERRVGGRIGFKKGYKKAIVKIKEGQKIEVLPR